MWFTASLLFEAVRENESPKEALFEEKIFLIRSSTMAEAEAEVKTIGSSEEQEYVAADGYLVRWVFKGVERIHEMQSETLGSGTEIFSRFITWEDAERALRLFGETGKTEKRKRGPS